MIPAEWLAAVVIAWIVVGLVLPLLVAAAALCDALRDRAHRRCRRRVAVLEDECARLRTRLAASRRAGWTP